MPRRRVGTLLPLELAILASGMDVQAAEGSFYGFALAQHLSDGAHGQKLTAHGTLYKALARLTDAGLLECEWEDPAVAEAARRPRRRLYRVSGMGEVAFSRARAEAAAVPASSVPQTFPGFAQVAPGALA